MNPVTLSYTCRGCLTVETTAILHSFETEIIRELFTNCTGVQLLTDDHNIPLQICSFCLGLCENWNLFRSRCLKNDEELRKRAEMCKNEPLESSSTGEVDHYIEEDELPEEEEQELETTEISMEEEESEGEVEESEEDDSIVEKPGDHSSTVYVCEECGENVKGMLMYTKHKFQHEMKLKTRVRNSGRIIETVEKRCGPSALQRCEEDKLLIKCWTQKLRKNLKNSGEEYLTASAVKVHKKRMKPVNCSTCSYMCMGSIKETEREQLHRSYWAMDFGDKRMFIHENVIEKSCRQKTPDSQRKFTLEYYLNDKRVCKRFFCATLDISDRIVRDCMDKARNNVDFTIDCRGRKGARMGRKKKKDKRLV